MRFWFLLLFLVSVVALDEHQHDDTRITPDQGSVKPLLEAPANVKSVGWPFHGKNKTDNSCSSHLSCFECATSSAFCHWCAYDNACHEKGSIHGCLEGVDCVNHTTPDHPKDKNETACASHMNCSECALSSSFCHWCAHDQACHSVGSVYGCVTGVDCYSNDRCRRQTPEPIDSLVFPEMGILPILVIAILGGICFCCSTLGYCVAGGVKGAYDDLAHLAAQSANTPTHPIVEQTRAVTQGDQETHQHENEESAPLIAEQSNSEYQLMPDEPAPPFMARRRTRAASRHMDCLFGACTVCYILSVAMVGGFIFAGMRYFPKAPQYNICNDALAWKSLVDSMTSMKIEANIEILVSVMNPNHFDVSLNMGKGSFTHDGAFVGTFEIPPSEAKAMMITDMMIIAKFTPEKWEALALTTEYYRGTLVLDVSSQASIRVPALANYSYEVDFKDMRVHVNDPNLMDRHLCACP